MKTRKRNNKIGSGLMGLGKTLLIVAVIAATAVAPAAVVDISGDGINIDDAVGVGNTGRLVGDTKNIWNEGEVSSDLDLNGWQLRADSGGGNPLTYSGDISGNGIFEQHGGQYWGGNWNNPIYITGDNTYTGTTNVREGRTLMNSTGTALLGTITVGTVDNARIQWDAGDQVDDSSDITVLTAAHPGYNGDTDNDNYLSLNGFSDTTDSLTLVGTAHVRTDDLDTNSGLLTVGSLSYDDGDGNVTDYAPGTYTSSDVDFIIGGGSIEVIPEPASAGLLVLVGGLAWFVRRNVRA